MVEYEYSDMFFIDSIPKQITIESDSAVLHNEDFYNQEVTLEESLCSENELIFGSCEASVIKFKISDIFTPMAGKWLHVKIAIDEKSDDPFPVGRYKVNSDKPSADRRSREIVAYDAMYDIINSSAINWYNTILPNKDSKVTMKQFRTSFINHFGLEQEETDLANDDMIVEKTIEVGEGTEIDEETEQISVLKESSLSGKDVITAICEINGCFGHIGRDGKFHYIYLAQDTMGLYPSNSLFPDHAPDYLPQAETGHLYPQSPQSARVGKERYVSADYEDFICRKINKVQIRQKENDIGAQYPEGKVENENTYIIEDNFLVYGKPAEELSVIAENIFRKIKDIVYRPFSADCIGNPCLEVGDAVRIPTRYELIESYILKRTLKGIQALRDDYSAEGAERRSEKSNSVSSSILQLKGKTNTLERNVEKTVSKIEDVESGLSSRIEQTVKSVSIAVSNDKSGKTAEVKLLITDEGGTQYEVRADKIDFTGLVSFRNLETGGETTINGNNITTGQINCDLLNGGTILGQIIEGGEVTGAVITAKDGIYLQYTDNSMRPPVIRSYLFAQTGYESNSSGGIIGSPFLNIYSPKGTSCMEIGTRQYSENKFKFRDTPFFPNGAVIRDAYIDTLKETAVEHLEAFDYISPTPPSFNVLVYHIRKSGALVSVYGTYKPYVHAGGDVRTFELLNNNIGYIPTHHSPRAVWSVANRLFTLQLSTDGKINIRNTGADLNRTEEQGPLEVYFRFDYFIFP